MTPVSARPRADAGDIPPEVVASARAYLQSSAAVSLVPLDGPTLEVAAEPFPVVRVLEGDPPMSPAVQVADLVLDRDINLWTGHGGVGKTVLLLGAGIGIVLGRPVFGTLVVHRPGPVLLVAPEDGQAAVRMMLDALAEGLGLSAGDRRLLADGLVMIPDDETLNITSDTRRLGATARAHEAVAVFLDPLSNLLAGASERDEDIATRVSDSIRRHICRASSASVVLNHHFRKPSKETGPDMAATQHDARGSGGWPNSARLVFGLSKRGSRITMIALKTNRLRADLRHELDLAIEADPQNPARWLSCRVVDANAGARSENLTAGIGRPLNPNEQTVLGCLDDHHEPGKRLSWSRWRDESGLRPESFRSVRERLLDAGLVTATPTGKRARNGSPEYSYALAESGRQALATGWAHRPEGVKL